MFQPLSSLWGPLLRAIWCHSVPGVARLLQGLPELWVGHWGWTGELHQDQFWQVCLTVLQTLDSGEKKICRFLQVHTELCPVPHFLCLYGVVWFPLEKIRLRMSNHFACHYSLLCQRKSIWHLSDFCLMQLRRKTVAYSHIILHIFSLLFSQKKELLTWS